jgi:NAD+ synthetase
MRRVMNNTPITTIEPDLLHFLEIIRMQYAFNTSKYIDKKCRLLNSYMRAHALCGCIVGISGGVDSAAVLALIHFAKQQKNSPISSILAVPIPTFSDGSSNQKDALNRGIEVCRTYGITPTILDMTHVHEELKKRIDSSINIRGNQLVSGQLVSYIRTPVLYYLSGLMAQKDTPSIVCGTTNYDESSYIGYYAKAGDGMVDVQLVSDIHKSELFTVAKFLDVPKRILDTPPSADVYHGKTDEEVFGFSYDFLELYLEYLALPVSTQKTYFTSWSTNAQHQFQRFGQLVEKFHSVGLHKYIGASSAVHLDIINRSIPEGLVRRCWQS